MADNDKKQGQSLPSGGREAHKGTASKEKGKTGNLQHSAGVLLSTGGGEPIDQGEKWTDEHRVLQPRNAADGKFTYNSEAHWGLKYKQRNKANTVPPSAKELVLAAGIQKAGGLKAGSVIVWNGKTMIILKDMSVDELYDYFKKYDEETGDYYKGRSLLEKGDKKNNQRLTSNMVAKQGRHSKAENEAIEATKDTWNKGDFGVVGHYDMSKLSNKTAAAIAQKAKETAEGFDPKGWSVPESTLESRTIGNRPENSIKVTGDHPSNPEPIDNPNPTGPGNPPKPPKDGGGGSKGSGKPNYPDGYKPDFEADLKTDVPEGLFDKGKIDQSKIDYEGSIKQRRFFDKLAKHFADKASEMGIPEDAAKLLASKKGGRFIAKKMKTSKAWGAKKYQWGF